MQSGYYEPHVRYALSEYVETVTVITFIVNFKLYLPSYVHTTYA